MVSLKNLQQDLYALADPAKAKLLQGFFKTGPGEYGAGDEFLGIIVPNQRMLAKTYRDLPLVDLKPLLNSKLHEERLTGLFILILQYQRACKEKAAASQEKIYNFYLKNVHGVNNWDLVDLSAPNIVGHYLFDKDKTILHEFVEDKNLWKRRIAIISTFYFIRQNHFRETLLFAEKLLVDREDLIHKASGWMLREVGKRDFKTAENFIKKYYRKMPRTMLRYALEKFPQAKRSFYMQKDPEK